MVRPLGAGNSRAARPPRASCGGSSPARRHAGQQEKRSRRAAGQAQPGLPRRAAASRQAAPSRRVRAGCSGAADPRRPRRRPDPLARRRRPQPPGQASPCRRPRWPPTGGPGPAAQHRPAGTPRGRAWSGPPRCRPVGRSGARGRPGSPGAAAGWSGHPRSSSSPQCSPRSCSPWRPGRRRPITAPPAAVRASMRHDRGPAGAEPVVDRASAEPQPTRGWSSSRSSSSTRWAARSRARREPVGAPGLSPRAAGQAPLAEGISLPVPAWPQGVFRKLTDRRVAACALGCCSTVTTTSSSYTAVVHPQVVVSGAGRIRAPGR